MSEWNFGSAISMIMAVIIMISMYVTRRLDKEMTASVQNGRECAMKNSKLSRRLILGCVMVFFYFPILYMLIFSFNGSRSLTSFDGFSLQWYHKMFNDRNMMEAIYYTLVTAVVATFVSTIVGTITAIGLSKSRRIVREVSCTADQRSSYHESGNRYCDVGLMLFYVSLHMEKGFLTMLLAHIAFVRRMI